MQIDVKLQLFTTTFQNNNNKVFEHYTISHALLDKMLELGLNIIARTFEFK